MVVDAGGAETCLLFVCTTGPAHPVGRPRRPSVLDAFGADRYDSPQILYSYSEGLTWLTRFRS